MEIVDPRQCSRWNEQVIQQAGCSVFHSVEWARVLLETYNWQPFYIRVGESILPLIEAGSWPTRGRGISLPFTDFCEPLIADNAAADHLFQAATKLGREHNWKYIECRGGGDHLCQEAVPSDTYFLHELDLQAGEASVYGKFDASVRRAIRKSEQSHVTVSIEYSMGALKDFWKLHLVTRRRHGVPPQPFRFMQKIYEELLSRGMGFIAIARWQGTPVAACVCLHFGKTAIYKFGASNSAFQHLRCSNSAFWGMIQHLCAKGFTALHLGRTDLDNEGLRRFKLGWGSTESMVNYSRFDLAAGRFVSASPRKSAKRVSRLVAFMPLWFSQVVGSVFYRYAV